MPTDDPKMGRKLSPFPSRFLLLVSLLWLIAACAGSGNWISNCNYDGAGEALKKMYGKRARRQSSLACVTSVRSPAIVV